ncbi:MAG: DUF5668 domain-containing protein [Acidobacteriota bacterium]|nr:DUF5668 domain-containing protein [Acidobacteriota bacterium]
MKCSYHDDREQREFCTACGKGLCAECTYTIRLKPYCQDCLAGAVDWMAARGRPAGDAPRRAAWLALIPGMGAVYNGEYLKAATHFAVFAALLMLGSGAHGVFGFGAMVFLVFTMFDSYRSAEERALRPAGPPEEEPGEERAILAWGVVLVLLGALLLLQNLIPFHFLHRLWPLLFIGLGGYLVYRALREKKRARALPPAERGEY